MIAVDPQTYWETVAKFTDSLPDVDVAIESGDAGAHTDRTVRRKRNAPKAGSKLAAGAPESCANNTNRPLPALSSSSALAQPAAEAGPIADHSIQDEQSAQREPPALECAPGHSPNRRSQSFNHKEHRSAHVDPLATSSAVDMSAVPDSSPARYRYRTTSGSETRLHHPHHNRQHTESASPTSVSANTSPSKRIADTAAISSSSSSPQNSSPKREAIRSPLVSILDCSSGSVGSNSVAARAARRARVADPSKLTAPVLPSSISLVPLLRKQHNEQQRHSETSDAEPKQTSESSEAADSTLHNVSEMLDASVRLQPPVPASAAGAGATGLPGASSATSLPDIFARTATSAAAAASDASGASAEAADDSSAAQTGASIAGGRIRMMRSQSGSSVIGAMLLLLDTLTLDELREVRTAVDERIRRANTRTPDEAASIAANDSLA